MVKQLIRSTAIMLAVITAGSGCGDDDPGYPPGKIVVPVTIATYNAQDFNLYNDSYNKIASYVSSNMIDIIFLQEVQPGDHPNDPAYWNSPNNAGDETAFAVALSNKGRPMNWHVFSDSGGITPIYGDYLAFYSRWPLQNSASILTGTYPDPVTGYEINCSTLRPVLYTQCVISNQLIHLYGIHLKAQGYPPDENQWDIIKRRAQAHALEEHIKKYHDTTKELVVLLGDANTALTATDGYSGDDFADNSTLGILCLKSDNPERTANDMIPLNVARLPANAWTHSVYESRLDHLIISPALDVFYQAGTVTVTTHPANDPSDHYPVSARFLPAQ